MLSIREILKQRDFDQRTEEITNLVQIIPYDTYPYFWHQKFSRFGKYAGFKNSIYEKYVFFPRGITNRWIIGELFMMNAQPFPGGDGLQRAVLSKKDGVYYYVHMSENAVQRVFKETGIAEPKAIPMPPLPPAPIEEQYREPLAEKRYKFFVRCAERMGMSYRQWWIVQYAVVSVFGIAALLTAVWIWRRSRA